jgi:hypothetical protein
VSVASQTEYVLLPLRGDGLTKPFVITPAEWHKAIALSRRNGYCPPDDRGLGRTEVRWFCRSLAQGLQQEKDADFRDKIAKLIQFIQSAAIVGFTLERRWMRAI